ncbi:MAG: hypothetical protein HKM89_15235 [Gemmatimonadales bacterium]|nr:hypothetical protein [Gemmatimonadales bacterium]
MVASPLLAPTVCDLRTVNFTPPEAPCLINDAEFSVPNPEVFGTGRIGPFVRLSANTPVISGVNTSGRPLPLDENNSPNFTRDLPLNEIPTAPCASGLCREFFLDINESSSTEDLSLDKIRIIRHEVPDAEPTAADVAGMLDGIPCPAVWGGSCFDVYNLDAGDDNRVDLNALNPGSGSGRQNMRMLIPVANFGAADAQCPYDQGLGGDCGVFIALASRFGDQLEQDGGFEEWDVAIRPIVVVTKDAIPQADQTFMWEIEKSVDPLSANIFTGDEQIAKYTIDVTLLPTMALSNWMVRGTITIENPSQAEGDAVITNVDDIITGGTAGDITAAVVCNPALPQTLSPGQSLECTYMANLPDGDPRTNTAFVTLETGAFQSSGFDFDFTGAVEIKSTINDTVSVDDDIAAGDRSDITASTTYMYNNTYDCSNEGDNPNTADLIGDGGVILDSDDATVEIICHDLAVTKNANTSLTRDFDWMITKLVDGISSQTVLAGVETATFSYDIMVAVTGFADSDWAVAGNVTITNPNPDKGAMLTGVADVVSPAIAASVNCGVTFPHTIPANGGTLVCTYSADLLDATDRSNEATATLQNKRWDKDGGVDATLGTTEFTGSANVNFANATIARVDECIEVVDDRATAATGDDVTLGTVCENVADGGDYVAPHTFNISITFGPFSTAQCDDNTFTNIATFETVDDANDTNESGTDTQTVTVTVLCPECEAGDRLTSVTLKVVNPSSIPVRIWVTDDNGNLTRATPLTPPSPIDVAALGTEFTVVPEAPNTFFDSQNLRFWLGTFGSAIKTNSNLKVHLSCSDDPFIGQQHFGTAGSLSVTLEKVFFETTQF